MSEAEPTTPADGPVRLGTARGRWVLLAAVLGSGMAGIDATVVDVALPELGADLDARFSDLQWVVTGYGLTLAAFILLGGTLGDRFGRRRVFLVGVGWFAVASIACGLAPNVETMIAARIGQGVGGALMTPASLAILQSGFCAEDRAKAIGAWSGLGGVATAIGPFLGGYLVEQVSWRWVFWINLPMAALVVWVTLRHVPESRDESAGDHLDWIGAGWAVAALAALTYATITANEQGWGAAEAIVLAAGVVALAVFVLVERSSPNPMVPPDVFASGQFRAINALTFIVYAALGVVFFLLVIQLQVVAGFGAVAAGASLLPVTVLMLLLSARSGALASRIGPRLQLTVGPAVCALALLWMRSIGGEADYVADVLGPVVLFGLGLAILVAPLTAHALSVVDDSHAGLASGVNNAVARTAGLVAVASIPALAGLSGADYENPAAFEAGFEIALLIGALLLAAASVAALALIKNEETAPRTEQPLTPRHCSVSSPPESSVKARSSRPEQD